MENPLFKNTEQEQIKTSTPPSPFQKLISVLWEIFKVVALTLLIIIPIRIWIIQPFFVSGASMEPSFDDGDYLVIDELSYHFREPERGEVVVFHSPEDEKQFYIKRIIGLPGERVELQDGQIIISNAEHTEGFVLDESKFDTMGFTFGNIKVKLGPDEYFVLGDNRSASSDSRKWGPVKKDLLVGRVWVRALPVSKFNVYSSQ